jgi:hypothetical protein
MWTLRSVVVDRGGQRPSAVTQLIKKCYFLNKFGGEPVVDRKMFAFPTSRHDSLTGERRGQCQYPSIKPGQDGDGNVD